MTVDTLVQTVKDSKLDFCLMMYDVPVGMPYLYGVIAKVLHKRALFVNLSCYLIQTAQRNQLELALAQAMDKTEQDCLKEGKPFRRIDYKILRFDPSETEKLRQISAQELNKQVADIGKSLLESIERYDEKLKANEYDIDTHVTRFSGAVRKAQRDLDEARGLAMLFLIDKDVATAIDAAAKVLSAQAGVLEKTKSIVKKAEESITKAEAVE
jgi:hypothetical protein